MSEYLLKIRNCIDLLGLVGERLSEKDHIDAIFEGLSAEYDTFVVAIDSSLDPYSVEDIESLFYSLKKQELRNIEGN